MSAQGIYDLQDKIQNFARFNYPAEQEIEGGKPMGGKARAKQSLSLGLSMLLVFTIGPGAVTGMADQGTGSVPIGATRLCSSSAVAGTP
jgi:hypothetical protein